MPKQVWWLIIGMAVNVTGSSFLWPLNAIYIHDHLGKSLSIAGVVLMFNSGASVIGNLFGGSLFDKIGGYRSILAGIGITTFSLIGMVWNHEWPYYVLFLIIIGFGSGIIFPSMYAMAGSVWKEGGRRAFNAIYVAQNVGVAVGSALGGIVASFSFDYIFMANLFMYLLFFVIALTKYKVLSNNMYVSTSVLKESGRVRNKTHLTALLILCGSYLLCWMVYVQWQTTIASYTQQLSIRLEQYSLLWAINGALIVLAQPFLGRVLKKMKDNLKAQILIGIVIFMISNLVGAFAASFSGFVVAMVILTFGEMLIWPAVPSFANHLAPKGREGFYQGLVNSTATGGRMLGPVVGGLIVDAFHMEALFYSLIGLLIAAFIIAYFFDLPLKKEGNQQPKASN
jgi:MFS family permease